MSDDSSDEVVFRIEVVKLLLQVAWSDDELDPRERAHVLEVAKRWDIPDEQVQVLMYRLDQGQPLPSPNLGLLKKQPEQALSAARSLMLADGKFAKDEADMLAQIKQLLGVTPNPDLPQSE
jgi:tellurite resistance protein